VQKKAQLVHWTDESDFQANSWLAGYAYLWFPIYNKIGYISRFCTCATATTEQAPAKLMILSFLTGALDAIQIRLVSERVRLSEKVRTRVRGPRANVVSSVSRCPRPLVSGRFRPRTQERGALCGQGTLRP